MLRTRIKKLLAAICIMVILLPYTSEVLAASLTHETEKALIETSRLHEGAIWRYRFSRCYVLFKC